MTTTALFIIHKTLPGKREEVKRIWMQHMAPAIQANPAHLAYFYSFDDHDPDSICAFQQYASGEDAQAFLQHPAYLEYLSHSRALLAHAPQILSLSPQWVKHA